MTPFSPSRAFPIALATSLASLPLAAGAAGSARADGLVTASAAPAPSAAVAARKPARPSYENLRFRENWCSLADLSACDRRDGFDALKAIRLTADGCVRVDFGGQARLRFESFDQQNAGGIPGSDDWWLARVRLHADVRAGAHLRAFVEGIYAYADGRDAGPRPVDENEPDFLNLFAEAHGSAGCDANVGVRVGRQELLFDKQRLVGPLDWANTRRTFDGVSAWLDRTTWRLDGFVTRPVVVDRDGLDERNSDVDFAGVWLAAKPWEGGKADAFVLYRRKEGARWLGVTDDESRWTVGAGANSPIAGTRLDWDAEAAVQFGTFGDDSILAGAATVELGWKPCVACFEPRLAIGLDWASGDDGPGGELGTYDPLFPTGHMFFGWVDLIGRSNLLAGRLTLTAKPHAKLTLRADFHAFRRASDDDAVYNAAGGVLRAPSGSDERAVGTELDLQVKWSIDPHTEVEVGGGRFFAGEFLEATGAHEDTDFLYASLTFTF